MQIRRIGLGAVEGLRITFLLIAGVQAGSAPNDARRQSPSNEFNILMFAHLRHVVTKFFEGLRS